MLHGGSGRLVKLGIIVVVVVVVMVVITDRLSSKGGDLGKGLL
jgi:hypothetical protein